MSMIPMDRVMERLDRYFESNDTAGAKRHLEYWIAEAKQTGDTRSLITLYNEKMGLHRRCGEGDDAIACAKAALAAAEREGISGTVSEGTVMINCATVYTAFGKVDDAQFGDRRLFQPDAHLDACAFCRLILYGRVVPGNQTDIEEPRIFNAVFRIKHRFDALEIVVVGCAGIGQFFDLQHRVGRNQRFGRAEHLNHEAFSFRVGADAGKRMDIFFKQFRTAQERQGGQKQNNAKQRRNQATMEHTAAMPRSHRYRHAFNLLSFQFRSGQQPVIFLQVLDDLFGV